MDEDKVIQKLIDHDEHLERMEEKMLTKEDGEQITGTLDKILGTVNKLEEELAFGNETFKRLRETDEQQQLEIEEIKEVLKI